MIKNEYLGRKLSDIPSREFRHGFDDLHLLDQGLPSLVLASLVSVPKHATSWYLASEYCGGFSCDVRDAAILPLPIRDDMLSALTSIVEESFAGDDGLDYFSLERNPEKIIAQYLTEINSYGLSCDTQLAQTLTQALYPLDASEKNLKLVTSMDIDLSLFSSDELKDLTIFIVGQNCD